MLSHKKGRVRAFYVTKSGKELTYEIIERGKIIGESSFLSHSLYPVSMEAVNDVELLSCSLNQLYVYMEKSNELAVSLGLNRVTVSRVLNEWKKENIIATAYGHIQILNRDYLEKLLFTFYSGPQSVLPNHLSTPSDPSFHQEEPAFHPFPSSDH
ncbi:MAG: Crp/Fnr family transcriptional regulator [Catenibacillus sp.]